MYKRKRRFFMGKILTMSTQYGTLTTEAKNMIKTISVRKLRTNLAHVLKDVKTRMDRYVISKRGEPEAILMCVDDFEGWLETLEVMSDNRTLDDIKQARKELAMGKSHSFEDVFGKGNKRAKK